MHRQSVRLRLRIDLSRAFTRRRHPLRRKRRALRPLPRPHRSRTTIPGTQPRNLPLQLPNPLLQHLILARQRQRLGLVESALVARAAEQEVLGQRADASAAGGRDGGGVDLAVGAGGGGAGEGVRAVEVAVAVGAEWEGGDRGAAGGGVIGCGCAYGGVR